MSSTYSYDEESTHAPFFILTLASIVAIPLTYNILKTSPDLENTGSRIQTDFKPNDEDIIQAQRRKKKRKERKTKRILCAAILWSLIAYSIYLIAVTKETLPQMWDPYTVLGVSRSASEREIDRHYKRLAIKYHPDKAQPDPSKNETLETVNDRWVDMTKAYKALTDEEIRNNYLLYGNPDGKQSINVGIAIPQWVVSGSSRWAVIAFYAALLGIFLPYVVGKWWYGTQSLTKHKILHSSAGKLFTEYKEDITEGGVVAAISTGDEYRDILKDGKADAGASKIESAVLASGILSKADIAKLKSIDDPLHRKTLSLLWAYLARVDLKDPDLNRQKYGVAPTAFLLNGSFSNITLPFLQTEPLLASYRVSQGLIQALPPGSSPALQLPHITTELASKISDSNKGSKLTIQKLLALPPAERRSVLPLSESEHAQIEHIASQIPHLHIAKAFFKVIGDRVVTPGSLVQLVVKGRIIPPGTSPKSIPEIDPSELEDPDPIEGDIDALKGRKDSSGKSTADQKPIQPPLAHAPYFAADHAPRWHIFLAEARSGRIAVPPFTFTAFDKEVFTKDGKPTFNVVTLKCQFQAPPQVMKFPFVMNVVCDSYVGLDSTLDVVLDVRDAKEAVEEVVEDDISEPDEDSLAGQMQALKSGGRSGQPATTTTTKKRAKKEIESSSDEEESDTEGEQDDTSETDTETEDEET